LNLFLKSLESSNLSRCQVHRVIIPEEEIKRGIPRQSIALFVKPDNGTLVMPVISAKGGNAPEAIDAAAHAEPLNGELECRQ